MAKDWPCWRGADGSGWMPCDVPLVRDMSKMKLVWQSEEKLMPSSYSFFMGGAGGPVVSDGKVFFFYMWPGGDLDQAYYDQNKDRVTGSKYLEKFSAETGVSPDELMRIKCRNKSDDVIIAMDLKTGKILGQVANRGDGASNFVGIGDRLVFDGYFFDANPKAFSELGFLMGLQKGAISTMLSRIRQRRPAVP